MTDMTKDCRKFLSILILCNAISGVGLAADPVGMQRWPSSMERLWSTREMVWHPPSRVLFSTMATASLPWTSRQRESSS
ncbi:MAG: hypothetical protein HZT41_12890 [Dechloromonas sp.]|nr:MAG: hypothetical protein HZT41_12890 [Dechloromonas sp.]